MKRALSIDQIAAIQAIRSEAEQRYPWRQNMPNGHPATVSSLARTYGVTHPTIMSALKLDIASAQ